MWGEEDGVFNIIGHHHFANAMIMMAIAIVFFTGMIDPRSFYDRRGNIMPRGNHHLSCTVSLLFLPRAGMWYGVNHAGNPSRHTVSRRPRKHSKNTMANSVAQHLNDVRRKSLGRTTTTMEHPKAILKRHQKSKEMINDHLGWCFEFPSQGCLIIWIDTKKRPSPYIYAIIVFILGRNSLTLSNSRFLRSREDEWIRMAWIRMATSIYF